MTSVQREWVGREGSGRIVRTDTDPQLVTLGDRQRWVEAGSPPLGGGPPIDDAELLHNSPLKPAQGAALYQVAATLSGIELLDDARDPAAGPAWASPSVTAAPDTNVPAGTVVDAV
jgi:hypothetical protein